jgi:type IV pilus assembly protein PilM
MADFIGLDIGSSTLKAVQVRGKRLFAFAYGSAPAGASLTTEDKESTARFSEAIGSLISSGNFKGRSVVVALPESQIFTRVISFPQMDIKEIASAVQNEAQQYVPLPLEKTTLDYEVLGPSEVEEGRIDVLLVAAPKALTKQYLNVLRQIQLHPISLEPETMALSRSVVGDTSKVPVMVASIGARTTDLSIFSGNTLRFTRSISTGGETLARAVSQNLGLDAGQAQEYLKSYGLLEEAKGKVSTAIKPVFDIIVEEIRRSLTYYTTRRKKQIGRIVLVGGVANLPGIVVYLTEALGIEVGRGDPWETIEVPGSFPREELARRAPDFAIAAGLALKEI